MSLLPIQVVSGSFGQGCPAQNKLVTGKTWIGALVNHIGCFTCKSLERILEKDEQGEDEEDDPQGSIAMSPARRPCRPPGGTDASTEADDASSSARNSKGPTAENLNHGWPRWKAVARTRRWRRWHPAQNGRVLFAGSWKGIRAFGINATIRDLRDRVCV